MMEAATASSRNFTLHFLVIGGGLAGLSAAIALSATGHKVTLLEGKKNFTEHGRGIQIPPNCSKIFGRWGILDKIRPLATMMQEINLRSYSTGELLSQSSLVPDLEEKYGATLMSVKRADLLSPLVDEARRLGVELITDCFIADIDFSAPSVQTRNGQRFQADVIIGADGERSFCRSALLGENPVAVPSGSLVYRFSIQADVVRQNRDLLYLVEPAKITSWLGPSQQVVCGELPSSGSFNVIFSTVDPSTAKEAVKQPGPQSCDIEEARSMFKDWAPDVKWLLDHTETCSYWPLMQSQQTEKWINKNGNFVLIGDAAHSMEPHLTQGAAQSIEDAAFLGEMFKRVERHHHIADALTIFRDVRQVRVAAISKRSTQVGRIWLLPDGPQQRERDRQLREQMPFEGYPNPYSDPSVQEWLFGYNLYDDAEHAWERYRKGEWVGVVGYQGTTARDA